MLCNSGLNVAGIHRPCWHPRYAAQRGESATHIRHRAETAAEEFRRIRPLPRRRAIRSVDRHVNRSGAVHELRRHRRLFLRRRSEGRAHASATRHRPTLNKGQLRTAKTVLAGEIAGSFGAPQIEGNVNSTTNAQQTLNEFGAGSHGAEDTGRQCHAPGRLSGRSDAVRSRHRPCWRNCVLIRRLAG